MLCYLVHWCCI